jgi:hypothetical protein
MQQCNANKCKHSEATAHNGTLFVLELSASFEPNVLLIIYD